MMLFRYKITKDILWSGSYTLHIQYQVGSCDKWKKFARKDLFDVCAELANDWWILNRPSISQQLNRIAYSLKTYGTMQELVTAYILSILKDNKKIMIKRNDTKKIKQMIDGFADNTWSDAIVIDEDELSEE